MNGSGRRPLLAVAALGLLPLTLFLPAPASALLLVILGAAASILARPRRRELLVATLLLAVAVTAASAPWVASLVAPASDGPEAWAEAVSGSWNRFLDDLATDAEDGAALLGEAPADREERRAAFRILADRAAAERGGRFTLLLVDPDGEAVAWGGDGLLQEPRPGTLVQRGFDVSAGFESVTVLAVRPLGDAPRPWRVVAGRSYPTDRWPFPVPDRIPDPVRWSVTPEAPSDEELAQRPGTAVVAPAGRPALVFQAGPGASGGEAEPRPPRRGRRWAWVALALLLFGAAISRGLGRPVGDRNDRETSDEEASDGEVSGGEEPGDPSARNPHSGRGLVGPSVLAGMGAFALALAGGARVPVAASLPVVVALVGFAAGCRVRRGTPRRAAAFGALGTGLVAALVWSLQRWAVLPAGGAISGPFAPIDLAAGIGLGVEAVCLRAALVGLVLAVVLLARRCPGDASSNEENPGAIDGPEREPGVGDRWVIASIALALGGAAVHDAGLLVLPFFLAAVASAAVWVSGRRLGRPAVLVLLTLAASLSSAGLAETIYRAQLRQQLAGPVLERMGPPTAGEWRALATSIDRHFDGLDLARRMPRDPARLDPRDLAFSLWKDSPLARLDALSAVVVESPDAPPTTFSLGLPLAEGEVTTAQMARWQELGLPVWEDLLMTGEGVLESGGAPWARVRWWLLPRPGFGLDPGSSDAFGEMRQGLLQAGLLRGGTPTDRLARGLPSPAAYGLYGPDGRALVSPWRDAAPLPPELDRDGGRRAVVETSEGRAWAWSRAGADGREVLFLPILGPVEALERVGIHALGNLLLLGLLAGAAALLALPRPAFRDLLGRTLRSYSKRLIIVLSSLLLLPLLLLDLVILSGAEERLNAEQRAAGEAALASAERVIGDYLLTQDPGFGFATVIDDDLLRWLASVVHHEINLYWGSAVYASSKPELFTAGLLPERIPGEIYARLALVGYQGGARTNRAGDTEYLEIYAPLRIPGQPGAGERLFLSTPLLAQQEAVARELASFRRTAVLVSAGLFALLVAVGLVLARRFTRPIEELVQGTRRIAAGAPSLDLAPTELELAALVEAVDEMARRIAESRERLMREKQVVERMVDNITSGVVSLDRERRVLMHNRVAEELLGVGVGDHLDEVLERSERLAPVAALVRRRGATLERSTLRLADPGGDGEEREWSLVWVPVPGVGEPSALLVVEDATEVLRGQRLEAWAEMARIIAHEIKNPLTPIRLSTEHLRSVRRESPAAFDEVFERCTTNILRQVEELHQIAGEFSTYSSIPRIDPRPGNLAATLGEVVDAYRSSPVTVRLDAPESPVEIRFDERLLRRAVRNLVENALRASAGKGEVDVHLSVGAGAGGDEARIAVRDRGPGVAPQHLGRIFDPYFSTHDSGTGLGLPIARRVAEEHGGAIGARNRPGGGLEVTIKLPL